MESTRNLSMEIIRVLPKAAIARKYNCSVQYVRKTLSGDSTCDTPRTRGIRRDAFDILHILLRDMSGEKYTWGNSLNKVNK